MQNLLYESLMSLKGIESDRHFASFPVSAPDLTLTYGELESRIAQGANLLRSYDVMPGDRVAVQIEKSLDGIIIYLAAVRIGAVFLPLNTSYTLSEIEYFIADAEPKVFIQSAEKSKTTREKIGQQTKVISHGSSEPDDWCVKLQTMPTDAPVEARDADELAAILYTSGTTGRSKGAMLSQGNLLANTQSLTKAWHYSAEDCLIHALPLFHTHGLFVAINLTLYNKARLTFLERFDLEAVLGLLDKASVLMGVPTFYTRLIASNILTREVCQNMRLFISGSAPLLAEDHQQFEALTGHAILERYGMTETNMTLSNSYKGERKPGYVGKPLSGVSARISSLEDGSPVSQGEIGMLQVKGDNVFKGYWRMPGKTAEEFTQDGYFITGDLARQDADGDFQIVGRNKDLIITGGLNVYPSELERVLNEFDGVAESAVIGLPHKDFGEQVLAVIATDLESDLAELERRLRDGVETELASFKRPREYRFVAELPRNTMGKVQKKALREEYADSVSQ